MAQCSFGKACIAASIPVQQANIGTLCGECRQYIRSELWRGGVANEATDFGGFLNDYVLLYLLLQSNTILPEKIVKLGKACVPDYKGKRRGLSHYLKHFESLCHFPDVEVVPTGVLSPQEFYDMISRGVMWKDVGAGIKHGLYSHRLQWHAVLAVVTNDFVTARAPGWNHGAYDLFVSQGSLEARRLNVWGKVFDASNTNCFRDPNFVEANCGSKDVRALIDTKYSKYLDMWKRIDEHAGREAIAAHKAAKADGEGGVEANALANQRYFDLSDQLWATYYFTQRNIIPVSLADQREFKHVFGVKPKPKDKSKRFTPHSAIVENKILRLQSQHMPTANEVQQRRANSGVDLDQFATW